MHLKYRILLASPILLLFAIFIPVALADNSCIDCHKKLTVFNESEKQLNEIRAKHSAKGISCSIECHADILDKLAKSNYEQWTNSKHAMFNVTCDRCHGGKTDSDTKEIAHTGIKRPSDTTSPVYYTNIPETCGKCHQKELDAFKESLHYKNLKALKQAPTCDTCHRPHLFRQLDETDVSGMCSNCHAPGQTKIPPESNDKAVTALKDAQTLKTEIINAENAIKNAKNEGKDISLAQKELDNAISVRNNLPVQWHGFNLDTFENTILSGIESARKAQENAGVKPVVTTTVKPVETKKSSGAGILISLIGIVAVFIFGRRFMRCK